MRTALSFPPHSSTTQRPQTQLPTSCPYELVDGRLHPNALLQGVKVQGLPTARLGGPCRHGLLAPSAPCARLHRLRRLHHASQAGGLGLRDTITTGRHRERMALGKRRRDSCTSTPGKEENRWLCEAYR